MRFAKNKLYVERYVKCANCGILIFETPTPSADETQTVAGRLYCSAWCVAWDAEHHARRSADKPDR